MINKLSINLIPSICVFGICCLFLALGAGCKKNDSSQQTEEKELQQWYMTNKPGEHLSSFDDLKPLWETVYMTEPSSELAVYEVSLSNPKKVYQKVSDAKYDKDGQLRNNIRLLLFKDKVTGQIIAGCYMSVLNEGKISIDLNSLHYKQVNQFDGKIMFFNLSGKLENGWEYKDGTITKRINGSLEGYYYGNKNPLGDLKSPVIGLNGSRFDRLMIYVPPACAFPQPDWRTSCVGVEGYMQCTAYLDGYFCVDQSPGGGGDGGYNPYGNGGNGGGTGSNPTINPPINKDIIDSLKGYSCAQALVKEIKTNICTDIALLIKTTFAKDDLVNITFKGDNSLIGTMIDGQEQAGNNSIYNAEFTVGLNPDVLTKSTQEYILVTMYHEALHAFFQRKLQLLGKAEFNRRYEGVNVSGGRLLGVPNDSHLSMAYQNYVKGLKDVLMKFNTSFNEDRAWALAKGGIIQLLPTEKTVNDQERDATKSGFTGTKCP